MQIFVVVGLSDAQRPDVLRRANSHYNPENVRNLDDGFFIAVDGKTTSEICKDLGFDGAGRISGVVLMAGYYYGWHNAELWEWMAARAKSNGG